MATERHGNILPALVLALLGSALPAQHEVEVARPDLDLALAEAGLVVLATPAGADRVRIERVLAGEHRGQDLELFQPAALCFHQRFPAEGPTRLLFLVRRPQGWVPLQRPGLMLAVPDGDPRTAALVELCGLLRRSRAQAPAEAVRPEAAATNAGIAAELARFATRQAAADAVLAEAALLALARRPDLARHLPAAERSALDRVLADPVRPHGLRDLCARTLVAARAPGIEERLLALFTDGKARELAPLCGRLLRHCDPEHATARMAEAFDRCGAAGRIQLVEALAATSDPRAATALRDLAGRDDLAPELRGRLRAWTETRHGRRR